MSDNYAVFNPYGSDIGFIIPRAIGAAPNLSNAAKLIYGNLRMHCGPKGDVYPSHKTMAEECGMSESRVRQGLKELEDYPLIQITRPEGQDRLLHRHNKYYFLWHSILDPDRNGLRSGRESVADQLKTGILKTNTASVASPQKGLGIKPHFPNGNGGTEPSSREAQILFLKLYREAHGHDYLPFRGKERKQIKDAYAALGHNPQQWRAMLVAFFDSEFIEDNRDAKLYSKHITGLLAPFINLWRDLIATEPGVGRITIIEN